MVMVEELNINQIGKSIAELLVQVGFAKSKREARQFITDGAVTLGEFKVTDPMARAVLTDDNKWKVLERIL